MVCENESERYRRAVEESGLDSEEARQALEELYNCIRFSESIIEGRDSHSASMDERLFLHMKRMREAWEELFGKVRPLPHSYIKRTLEVRTQIFSKPETAMIFSDALTEAFKKSGIELKDHEMFELKVFIREKPAYISELLSSSRSRENPPVDFITEKTNIIGVTVLMR